MELEGVVHDGVIVPDDATALPEGARVRIILTPVDEPKPFGERFAQFKGAVPELPVGVRLIFQAAEELMPGGAIDAIAAGAITGVSRIFALHCDPRLEVGKIAVRHGPITSAADQIEITLYSPGGHTSRPHLTADLVYGLGTLITGLPGVLSRRIDPRSGAPPREDRRPLRTAPRRRAARAAGEPLRAAGRGLHRSADD